MATQDLTTLAAVREHLQISDAADTDQDALISSLITVVSDSIMRYAQREFVTTASNGTSRDFRYDGRGLLDFAPYDLNSIDSILIDVDGVTPTSITLTADEYRALPVLKHDGVWHSIQLRGYNVAKADSSTGYSNFRVVRITGDWGFASVPGPVARAAIVSVVAMLRSTSQLMGDELGVDVGGENRVVLPGLVKRLLDPYRKRAI